MLLLAPLDLKDPSKEGVNDLKEKDQPPDEFRAKLRQFASIFNAAIKASCGISTRPN